MNAILAHWNATAEEEAIREILPACGSTEWARSLTSRRPFSDSDELLRASDVVWKALAPSDWQEAFESHPRIGERKMPATATERSANWSKQEQGGVAESSAAVLEKLAAGNQEYENRFGRIFIVCATGKSAEEMLSILQRRLQNEDEQELMESAEQQRQIIGIRLRKWLQV